MPFNIVRKDITKINVDAIVISPPSLSDDPHIKDVGEDYLKDSSKYGKHEGNMRIVSNDCNSKARYVISTGACKDRLSSIDDLESCYASIFETALSLNINSLAIPLVGSKHYSFLLEDALSIATKSIASFLLNHDMEIYLVLKESQHFYEVSKQFQYVAEYIDDHYVDLVTHNSALKKVDDSILLSEEHQVLRAPVIQKDSNQSLEEYIKTLDEGFTVTLLKLIDRSGHDDTYIYKKANIDRKLFSKIRTNKDYRPSKVTALAFAIALELSIDDTLDLLSRAGYIMSSSSRFDLIVEYHIKNSIYNIYSINEALFAFDQPLLGS